MDNTHVLKETTVTVEEKHLFLLLPHHGSIFLQTRSKSERSLKNILNRGKVQVAFNSMTRLGNAF